jgi:H+/Cl- antiporter ClcA
VRSVFEVAGVLLRTAALAVGVGVLLGVLTKAVIELFNGVIVVLWTWLPDQLGVDPSSFFYLAAVLGVGGVLVGLGQRYLGYHPRPLEQIRADVEHGVGVDTRTIPRTLGNSVASLGFGAPLGPEAALVAVVGGTFAWATRLYDRAPVLVALADGLVVAVLATPSFLVLFSGTEDMRLLFDGSQSPAALTYGAAAKWRAMMVVFATD